MSDEQAQPRTWWSGDSSPEDKQNIALAVAVALLIFAVVSPISALTVAICLFLFSRVRISHRVIGGFSLFYFLILAITGLLGKSIGWYIISFDGIRQAIQQTVEVDSGFVAQVLLYQLPLSIFVGTFLGFIVCWYKWFRRPVWQETNFRLGPIQYYIKKKNMRDLKEGKNPPKDGATLGINAQGKKIIQTDEEAASHTFIPGASGAGKTTTMMTQAKDHIRRGHGITFVDLKGSTDVPEILYEYAERYGRNFYHFVIQDPRDPYEGPDPSGPSYYDPLGRGDASRRKDMIIAGRRWSEDYYKAIASSYLQTAFNVAIAVPPDEGVDSLSDIISLLNPVNLGARVKRMPLDPYYDEVRGYAEDWTKSKLDKSAESAINGVMKELQILRGSSAGKWLREPPAGKKKINLKEIADRGDVVVFSLDSSNYEGLAPLVGNFIIQDLKTVSSELRVAPSAEPMHIFIDEFSAMDSSNVINLINKSRDAKMPVTLSTQALGDLRKVDPTFMDQLLGIINCFIIHRANTEEDMEIYAGLTGKTKKWKARYGVEHTSGGIIAGGVGRGAATGAGTVEQVEDYRVSPHEIQELKRGQAIYVAMSPNQRLERVSVIPEEGKVAREDGKEARTISAVAIDVLDDAPLAMPSLSPETVRPKMKRGLLQESSPIAQIGPGPSVTEDDDKEPELPAIVPKHSSGMLNGRDLNALLNGSQSKPVAPAVAPAEKPVKSSPSPVSNTKDHATAKRATSVKPDTTRRENGSESSTSSTPIQEPKTNKPVLPQQPAPSVPTVPTRPVTTSRKLPSAPSMPSLPKPGAKTTPLPATPAINKQQSPNPTKIQGQVKSSTKKSSEEASHNGPKKQSVVGDWGDSW